ncbi:Formamidopyrimidine-DNA glycosylase N-terminal domain-domain-containing protein [Coniella lustricola]|uniref:Formamidopyrimidine-DNA glycosylase N-terminal domain-domain-containing protein n=1 Tax=Coniella lustricola TaxID=2025994 RepID=A0A2T3AM34_9PEZI|nr:Formamidopyrimidine-DNA glycosylase N-terminal domain-domain-containing protein [Coniella lustricola]
MPEIAEVSRLVHFLRQHLVGKKIAKVQAPDDANIFGKVGCSGPAFEKALQGRKVVGAGSQGKYFWLQLNDPGAHPVMHLGMTGWIHIQNDRTAYTNYYKKISPDEQDAWPPRFWKFQLATEGKSPVRIAFTDSRRFARIRLVECLGAEIRQNSPLVENGPDPVVDKDIFTEEYLHNQMQKRHKPIKALILDQTVISGIGNWVADECLYHAKLHPEQYCNEFSDAEMTRLYNSIRYVCQTAVDLLADSDQFPDTWLFDHRWGKGSKAGALPNGERLAWITVGGRTSCYAPGLQKMTGHVAPGIKEAATHDAATDEEPSRGKAKNKKDYEEDAPKPQRSTLKRSRAEDGDDELHVSVKPSPKKTKAKQQKDTEKQKPPRAVQTKKAKASSSAVATSGQRRSARLSKGT